MRFVETLIFTGQITALVADAEYRELQQALLLRPTLGPVIRGSGGLRKVRWASAGSGRRGGIRVIYYWHVLDRAFFMLFAYPKSMQDNLTQRQLALLRRVVEEEFQ